MIQKIFNPQPKEEIDWSGLEWLPGQDPQGVMLKHYEAFKKRYPANSADYIWARWIRSY